MAFQKLINKLTDRDKLINEIDVLKSRVSQLEHEKYVLIKELTLRNEDLSKLHSVNNELQELTKLNSEVIQQLKEQAKELIIKNQTLSESERNYRKQYGNIHISEPSENLVGDWDVDKDFFDHMEKIKGNPFNKDQVEAIRYTMDKNLRIIAGAGSGKTETICAKTAYLMTMESVEASSICMVTFTRKAADEMKERVNKFLVTDNSRVAIGTFHSIFKSLFEQLLKQVPACASVGVVGNKQDDSDEKANRLFRQLIKKYNLFQFDKEGDKTIKERIEYWTNLGHSAEEMKGFVAKHYDSLEPLSDYPINQRFYDMYIEFVRIRTEEKIVLFDDFLLNLYRALQQYESARGFIQGKFDYIFVDEFQDINPLQMDILKLIAPTDGSGAKLIIVGDDDQSIYAFRGSNPSFIKQFHEVYDTYTLELMTNYRSKQNIVQAGNRVIKANAHDRIEKAMEPFHKVNGEAYVWAATDQSEEANWIITKAQEIGKIEPFSVKDRVEPINYTQSTILYRSVGQLQSVYQALDNRGVPFVIENNEDVMGIFNIFEFKIAIRNWLDLLESEPLIQISAWRPFLLNVANAYFIKNQDFNQFMEQSHFSSVQSLLQEFVAFVKREKGKSDTTLIEKYLNGIFKLIKNSNVEVLEFIEPLLQFPKNKNNMSKEEVDWINKECQHYKTWVDLIAYHERLKERRSNMKKHLVLYHKGEYNALYFLTIHKSKGLAFNNVFVIAVNDGGLPSNRAVPLSKINLTECREKAEPPTTVEEERRLMYVAATRAKHNLYVTFPKTIQDKPSKRSIFIKELSLPLRNG
ncbi:ATP-dependent helicase [Cohnella sp. LGH]|uniref:ATP-dependent helicase n=1 Tax=Cohnella sp. LGH TaxID=1619153 RepID=UPI001AD9F3DD|nr:ATP-dependent helicase [Cohnella sp. LGH]QTH44021.1 ATP-dependent helicase [Cohnella sp. LGH]